MNTDNYEVVRAEIHRKAIENVTNEMATSLVRTSGSPTVVDAKDFSTCVMDLVPEHLGFAAYVLLHFGTSLLGTRYVSDLSKQTQDFGPGDGWIINDPYEGGAAHQGDVAIIMPMFHHDDHVGWGFANMHMLDVGGSGLGGIAPGATDVYAEGLRFPAIRAIRGGLLLPEWERFIAANVRASGHVLNDVRSMIAANVVGNRKLAAVIDKFGRTDYEHFCRLNKDITEQVVRKRIERIPEGIYRAREWSEFDGHDGPDRLLDLDVQLEVTNRELRFKFRGAPQIDGFVNAGKGAMWGQVASAVLTTLAYGDIRVNGGFWRPIAIDTGPPGTVVCAAAPAPVSNGHVAIGTRATKLVFDVLSQALSLSDDPILRGRIGAKPHDGPPVAGLMGRNQHSSTSVMFYLDHASGIGGGAQTTGDGQDAYGCACMTGCGLTDLEIHEREDPLLFLSRRVVANSGGPGYHRGGQGIEQVFTVHGSQRLLGQLSNPCAEVPAAGVGGGFPGSTATVTVLTDTNVAGKVSRGELPTLSGLKGKPMFLPNNTNRLLLGSGDVLSIAGGGGGGLGDPLLRESERVLEDVTNGYITMDHAKLAYGVVIVEDRVDQKRTEAARLSILTARLGHSPARPLKLPADPGVAVTARRLNGGWACTSCSSSIAPLTGNWRDGAIVSESDIVTRLEKLGMSVRRRREEPLVMIREYFCPECAMALSVEVALATSAQSEAPDLRELASA